MATRREDILVSIGGDAKALMKELNMTKQQLQAWAQVTSQRVGVDASSSWAKFTNQAKEAGKAQAEAAKQTDSFGKALTKVAVVFGAFKEIKQIFREALQSIKDVAEELGKLNADFNASPYLKKLRDKQLSGMSRSEQENIVAGNVQIEGGKNFIKDYLAKAAGLYSFAADAAKIYATDKGASGTGVSLNDALAKASQNQKDIIEGVRVAAMEEAAAAEKKKRDEQDAKARADQDKKVTDAWDKYAEKNREKVEKAKELSLKKQNDLLEAQKAIQQELVDRQAKASGLLGQWKANLREEFLPSLDELATTGIFQQDAQRLQFLQADTKDAILYGDTAGRDSNLREIQDIRNRLTAAGVYKDPNQGVIDELKALTEPVRTKGRLPVQVILAK